MKPAGLLSLPEEMLQHISSYLTVKDILSCSLTCHYLRSALNHDCVWRRYLPEQDMSQLKLAEQQVQPVLQLNDSLTPLCDKRLLYIRRTRLINNWREDKFVELSTQTSYSDNYSPLFTHEKVGQLIYNDRYLFVGLCMLKDDRISYRIDIWDVGNVPVLHSSLTFKMFETFFIVGSYLVVIECFKVNVYQITLPEIECLLVFSFLITDEIGTFHEQVFHTCWPHKLCMDWSHCFAGQYLMSNKKGQCTFHVWDISNTCKVGSFLSPIKDLKCFSIDIHSYVGNEWFLRQVTPSKLHTYCFKFNIEKRTFSDPIFKHENSFTELFYYNSHIITFKNVSGSDSEKCSEALECTVYDFNTTVELKKRIFDDVYIPFADFDDVYLPFADFGNGTFLLKNVNYLQIINALTLKEVYRFHCGLNNNIVKHFSILGSFFVVTTDTRGILTVWDIKSKKNLSKQFAKGEEPFNYNNYLCATPTKLVFFNVKCVQCVRVLHFW